MLLLFGCASAPDARCIGSVPNGSARLEHRPPNIVAPPEVQSKPAGYVEFWYASPDDKLVLCRYEESLPACFDNMNGATFVRDDGNWIYKDSFDVVCNIDQ